MRACGEARLREIRKLNGIGIKRVHPRKTLPEPTDAERRATLRFDEDKFLLDLCEKHLDATHS